jgi:hypothetical protein
VPAKIKIKARRKKYRNVPVWVDGARFDSKKEAVRWHTLRLLQKAGRISGLERQQRYNLFVNGIKVAAYVADFVYWENNRRVVEDAKGYRTRDYQIKKKLMLAVWGITIRET